MSSRFLQGDGYPVLTRYNASNVLQETVNMPYVLDDGNNSYVRLYLDPYPEDAVRQYKLLDGSQNDDVPMGNNLRVEIKYVSILATELQPIFNCLLITRNNTGHYLKLKPRHNFTGDYKVIYKGNFPLESGNMWKHSVTFQFTGIDLQPNSFTFEIP
jgi:hypothetical protein